MRGIVMFLTIIVIAWGVYDFVNQPVAAIEAIDQHTPQAAVIIPIPFPQVYLVAVQTRTPENRTYAAMERMALLEAPYDINKLMRKWGRNSAYGKQLAQWFTDAGAAYGIDPIDLAAMAWHESRWNPAAMGDCGCYVNQRKTADTRVQCRGDWVCVSCGILQANMGLDRTKWNLTCAQVIRHPDVLIHRAAKQLAEYREPNGILPLGRYNCPNCKVPPAYEWRVRRIAEVGRRIPTETRLW